MFLANPAVMMSSRDAFRHRLFLSPFPRHLYPHTSIYEAGRKEKGKVDFRNGPCGQ